MNPSRPLKKTSGVPYTSESPKAASKNLESARLRSKASSLPPSPPARRFRTCEKRLAAFATRRAMSVSSMVRESIIEIHCGSLSLRLSR